MLKRALGTSLSLLLLLSGTSVAMHPLITDDAGTVGKRSFQFEFNFEAARERSNGEIDETSEVASTMTYGIHDGVDLVFTVPYQFVKTRFDGGKTSDDGFSDISIEAKWRFFDKDGWMLAVKPGVSLPSGDEDKGLGSGRVSPQLFFIASRECDPFAFHFNAGYLRNENDIDERNNLWHFSLASTVKICDWLTAVANIGAERNSDKLSDTPAAFILGGFVFPVTENLAFDLGVKGGITEPEDDITWLAGVTLNF